MRVKPARNLGCECCGNIAEKILAKCAACKKQITGFFCAKCKEIMSNQDWCGWLGATDDSIFYNLRTYKEGY